jgi:hypothetical protein
MTATTERTAILANTDADIQHRAYTVLGELLALPLAAATWTIRRSGGLDALVDGRLPDYHGHNWRAEVLLYAAELDLAIRRVPMPGHPGSTRFEAHGTWRGVHIAVWTPMSADDVKEWGR